MPLGLSPIEVGIVILLIVVLFGANQLPKIARSSGRQLKQTKEAVGSFKEEFDKGMSDLNPVSGWVTGCASPLSNGATHTRALSPEGSRSPYAIWRPSSEMSAPVNPAVDVRRRRLFHGPRAPGRAPPAPRHFKTTSPCRPDL